MYAERIYVAKSNSFIFAMWKTPVSYNCRYDFCSQFCQLFIIDERKNDVIIHEPHSLLGVHPSCAISYSLFPVACQDNARRDVAFMSVRVIAESVISLSILLPL